MDFSSCRTVEDVARVVIKGNRPRYQDRLVELIPEAIRKCDPEDKRCAVTERLNRLRFEKEAALSKKLGVNYPPKSAHDEVTYKRCLESFGYGRPRDVEALCIEIKFLFNVASVIDRF